MKPLRQLLCATSLFVASLASADERPAAPSADCLDARAVVQARQIDPQRLLIETEQARHALTLAGSCATQADTEVSLLSPHGWVCGGRGDVEFVRAGAQRCAIDQVLPLSAKAYAAELREADRQLAAGGTPSGSAPTLAAVEVHAKAPDSTRFLRSTAYCFDPRWVRGFSSDAKGLLVDTSPRRSGGNRQYRVELGHSCPELQMSQAVSFHSGVGGAICGNAGDHARPIRGIPEGFDPGGIDGVRFSAAGCPIVAVYPVRSPSES
jgi:hypothetical protein